MTPAWPRIGVSLVAGIALLAGLACSGGSREPDAGTGAASEVPSSALDLGAPVTVRIVAKDLRFDVRTITVPRESQVTVTLDNQDEMVLHNIAFYTDSTAGIRISVGDLFPGVASGEHHFESPSTPGTYFFRCDIHPGTMTGTLTVE